MSDIPAEAAALLRDAPVVAHLATCRDGRPHVAPVWYRYDDGVVELVTSGRKLRNVRANPYVALSFERDPAGEAAWMVSTRGTAEVVEDDERFGAVNRRINEKYGEDPDAYADNTLVTVELGSATYRTY